jgi:hypothetical protein
MNWTSGLRQYEDLPRRAEGPADFVYNGRHMNALRECFRLSNSEEWEAVYIEVKSTGGSEKFYFHLSEAQFELVNTILDRDLLFRCKRNMAREFCI